MASVTPFLDRGPDSGSDLHAPALACQRFQNAEMLRIGLGDLGGMLDLSSVTRQLSDVADGIVRACLAVSAAHVRGDTSGFAVLAMGKLGGGELNYSSDIDLIFISDDQSPGDRSSYFQRLGQTLIKTLTDATGEGFLYRVDMRLRPWGSVGPLVCSRRGYVTYLQHNARLWEKQALLRARTIAGSRHVGAAFLDEAAPFIFGCDMEMIRADVYAMKQRTEAWLRQTGHDWGEVKLGEGSIRDVEFATQFLQLVHGGDHPALRTGTTMQALSVLAEGGFLSPADYRVLADGYLFLRTLEHSLQIHEYQQTHILPSNPADLRYLARRMGFAGPDSADQLVTRYLQHSAAVRQVYFRYLRPITNPGQAPARADHLLDDETGDHVMTLHSSVPPQSALSGKEQPADGLSLADLDASVRQHLARMPASYATAFDVGEICRHTELAGLLNDDNPVEVRADALSDQWWRVTIVAYDYLGELSLICGLLFTYGFSIMDGQVHTYEPLPVSRGTAAGLASTAGDRRKIVDVFRARLAFPSRAGGVDGLWLRYANDLTSLLRLLQAHRQRDAQGELAKRVSAALPQTPGTVPVLHPIAIEIDNQESDLYTVLRIDTPDTVGFLYEFTNALALNGVYIAQVAVSSSGNRVHDTLYVSDAHGRKLTGAARERELRAATVLVKHFTHLLPHSPNPETALQHFHEYLGELFRRPSWPDELASLEQPQVLDALARLLGVSDFLWDDFLRMQYANLFPVVQNTESLSTAKGQGQLTTELQSVLAMAPDIPAKLTELNAFKDREMFRIDMRHILGHMKDFGQFSAELTALVEAVVATACTICMDELTRQFGRPCDETGVAIPLSLCVLGKCGGYELGYASDIEVMFIYGGSGHTTGPRPITAAEFFEKLVVEFMRTIWARREGIFEIDLDLRPYGKAGSLSVSLDSFRRYFAPGGPAWAYERQALVKLRPVAGDENLGEQIEALRDAYVYDAGPFDVAAMRAMRERQITSPRHPWHLQRQVQPGRAGRRRVHGSGPSDHARAFPPGAALDQHTSGCESSDSSGRSIARARCRAV